MKFSGSVLKAYLQNFQNLSYLVTGTMDTNSSSRLVSSIFLVIKYTKLWFSIFEAVNFFPQFLQKFFAFPACDFSCLFNINLSLDFFKHSLHLNSVFLIKYVAKCLLKLSGLVNSLELFSIYNLFPYDFSYVYWHFCYVLLLSDILDINTENPFLCMFYNFYIFYLI